MMKSRTLPLIITMAMVLFAFVAAIGTAAAVPSATRILPTSVSPGADFQVAISCSDIGAAGQVNETLPSGFTYVNSSLSSGVVTGTNWVEFILFGVSSLTYNVTASDVAGTHTFAGTVKDFERNVAVVGGNTELTVSEAGAVTLEWQTEPPVSVTQGANVTFDVSFSDTAAYYFRIENSASDEVWRYPTTGAGNAMNPNSRTWTTTTETPPDDYTIIVSIGGMDNADTRTVTVKAGTTPTLASIAISSASYDLIAGNTQIFTATCTDTTDDVMTCPTLTWSSSNVTVGTITAAGVFSALAEGTTNITASADGVTSNDALVTVSPAIVQINSWTSPAAGNLGAAIDATVTIENMGTGRWFVVSVAGTSTTGKSIVGLGTIELDAGEIKAVKVKIPVLGDSGAAGTYTLYPDVYTFEGYPDVNAIQATGSGDTIVIS
ncbi:MAG: Ig-like domain-containing protein [Methanosarcinales archaeon]|nr:Ig-like domain-containing protein [Methanosarcinales archaeon]